jgi:hypothetical protein
MSLVQEGRGRIADLNVLEFVNTLNEALCKLHSTNCVDDNGVVHPEVIKQCKVTFARSEEIRKAYIEVGNVPQGSPESLCQDKDERCGQWVKGGDCDSNAGELFEWHRH